MLSVSSVQSLERGEGIEVVWENESRARFHAVWLRDHAPDKDTLAPGNGQRLIRVQDIPADVRVETVSRKDSGKISVTFGPENKTTEFDAEWLLTNRYDRPEMASQEPGWTRKEVVRWGAELQPELPVESFEKAREQGVELYRWLRDVDRYGVAKMVDMPVESGAICKVVDLFGFVRETNYGRFFEVRTEVNPVNLAYTGLGLQVHTDNPYRDPVPTLQLLSCLDNSVEGGDSVVVDAFKAVEVLREEAPQKFDLLAGYPACYTYAGTSEVYLASKRPMIELGPDNELIAVRFNNRSIGPLTEIPFEKMAAYYDAYRHLAEIVERAELQVAFKLKPGELFIVDNTRVLHGRVAYESSGSRWFQGCYADTDSLRSRLATLNQELG